MDNNLLNMEVGSIVAANFSSADVFFKYGIDFCCHGNISLKNACIDKGIDVNNVIAELNNKKESGIAKNNFSDWPLDLLIDYVLKIHHRGIRKNGPEILELIEKVESAHGHNHPELNEVMLLFHQSLIDLDSHLQKEENVLFPFLYELFEASEADDSIQQMHCGTVNNPIKVMRMEHEGEGDRYQRITEITNNFAIPDDGCNTYNLMMIKLKNFVQNLYEHIHIENNIIFPMASQLERQCVR